jgi:predicted nucleotide-binding protein (sugar kinase/HSP70/actin superfamily)
VGEAILTVGASLTEVLEEYCGVIAIGPFGCMPNRIAEAILSREMNREGKQALKGNNATVLRLLEQVDHLPFLALESDGGPFPQIITAKLETFLLQARRLHEAMRDLRVKKRREPPPLPRREIPRCFGPQWTRAVRARIGQPFDQ